MRCDTKIFLFLLCGVVLAQDAFAAAAMQRRLQQQKMMQEQAYQQAYQQAMAQKQAQEVAAYQQAVARKQAVEQQVAYQQAAMQYAAQKQAMQQAIAQRQAQQFAYQQAMVQRRAQEEALARRQVLVAGQYRQAVAQKQVAQVVAYKQGVAQQQAVRAKVQGDVNEQVREYAQYLAARKAALAQQGVLVQEAVIGQKVLRDAALQRAQAEQARRIVQAKVVGEAAARSVMGQKLANDVMGSQVKTGSRLVKESAASGQDTVVGIQELWAALDRSSEPWAQIIDKEIKLLTVSEYIDRFKKSKVKIKKDPGHYVGLIDSLADQMPGFLSASFMNVLSYAAIVEYDFENGTSKDDLARQVLGAGQFESNRKRVFGH